MLRGAIVNRAYGTHKAFYTSLFFTDNFRFYVLSYPVIAYLARYPSVKFVGRCVEAVLSKVIAHQG